MIEAVSNILVLNGVEKHLASRLGQYAALVLERNRSVNLTGAREPAAFAAHILDALTLRPYIDGPLIDLGSGAGLPGVPLAIATGVRVTLVDSIRKKVDVLESVLQALELDGTAVCGRAESLGRDPALRETFRCATARAVSSSPVCAELTIPFLALGGRALLQRGRLDDIERRAVYDAAPMLGAVVEEIAAVSGENRAILVLRKDRMTPARFPRREGIPEKRPLCFSST